MLVLSRKKGQKLIINDNIEVIIIEADSGIAKIGIKAPKNVSIYREELYIELKKANETSKSSKIDTLFTLEKHINNLAIENKLKSLSVKITKNEKK